MAVLPPSSTTIMLVLLFLFLAGHSSFHGSLARSTENIVQLSNREFDVLSRDLINRRYYTGAAVLQLYIVRSELSRGVTLLIPVDASLTQASGIRHQYRGLVKFHMLETNLNFRALRLLPVGTWLPTELPGYGVEVTHNSDTFFALNHVPIVEPNICPSLVQRDITCHGVQGVLNPLSTLSPKPYSVPQTSRAPLNTSIPSPAPSPSPTVAPVSSPMSIAAPTPSTSFPSLPPVFQSPVTNPTPPFGIPPFLLAPTSEPLENKAMPIRMSHVHIFVLVAFFLAHCMIVN
ncbi:hypothetical protein L7F22_005335 [Adiantum nelumboides]|nr:hypothetical protein [Adiantum nelumboides]